MWTSDSMDQAPDDPNSNFAVRSDPKKDLRDGRNMVEALEQALTNLYIENTLRIDVWKEELKTYVHDTALCFTKLIAYCYEASNKRQKTFRRRLLPFVEVRIQLYLSDNVC